MANEIPPLDETANIHLLIGRDAPELLKGQEFRNRPKGTPWAQRLSLGWTIIGQMCLDLTGPYARARLPYQSLTGQLHQLKEENTGTAVLQTRSVP